MRKTKLQPIKNGEPYVITVACQKGGVGKTSCAITLSTLLANMGYRVLGVDADQQSNYTETFTGIPARQLRKMGYLGVVFAVNPAENPKEYLWDDKEFEMKLPPNLDLLIGDERTGFFSERIREYEIPDRNKALNAMLKRFKDKYDFIIIDTAPALSPMLTNALMASDGVVCMYQPEKYCYSALFSLFETIEEVKNGNPKLRPLGILTALMDSRRSDMKQFVDAVFENEALGKYCFKAIIKRSAATGRLAYAGVNKETNPEAELGMKQYLPFVKELLNRVKESKS
jgi:chromosome partitioning protein